MREPGASEVLMCGCTCKPALTAFLASSPAASKTLGLDVLIQDVMAAIRMSPWPSVSAPGAASAGAMSASSGAARMVGRLDTISAISRGAPCGIGGRIRHALDRKSTRLNSSHSQISYAGFCFEKESRKFSKSSERKLIYILLRHDRMSWEQVASMTMPQFYFIISAYNEDIRINNLPPKRSRRK